VGAPGQLEEEISGSSKHVPLDADNLFSITGRCQRSWPQAFSNVDVKPEDTPFGVRVTLWCRQTCALRQVSVNTIPDTKQRIVPQKLAIDDIF
jgi:hypothetical protein